MGQYEFNINYPVMITDGELLLGKFVHGNFNGTDVGETSLVFKIDGNKLWTTEKLSVRLLPILSQLKLRRTQIEEASASSVSTQKWTAS